MNQATYEEVIGLIKAAPKSQDIVLWVENSGKIPVQECSGEPIRWIPVDQLMDHDQHTATSLVRKLVNYQTDDSAVSSGSLASTITSGSSTRSAGSLSSISSPSEVSYSASEHDEFDDLELARPTEETLVCVPGGRKSNETFGCGVVKGPDEWPGIFVQNVKADSLAERVGLQPGDQLTRADGHLLDEMPFELAIGLIKSLQQQQDELKLHVRRGAALRHLAGSKSAAKQPAARLQQEPPVDSSSPAVIARQSAKQQVRSVPGAKLISDTQSQLSAAATSPASSSLAGALAEVDADTDGDFSRVHNANPSQDGQATRSAIKSEMEISATTGLNIINSSRLGGAKATRQADKLDEFTTSHAVSSRARRPRQLDEPRASLAALKKSAGEMIYQISAQAGLSGEQKQPLKRPNQSQEVENESNPAELVEQEADVNSANDEQLEQVKILGQTCKLHHYNRRQLAAVKASRGIICGHSHEARTITDSREAQQVPVARPPVASSYSRLQNQRLQHQHQQPNQQSQLLEQDSCKRPSRRQPGNMCEMQRHERKLAPRVAPIASRLSRYISMESLVEQQPALSSCQLAAIRPRFRYVRSSSSSRQVDALSQVGCIHEPGEMCCARLQARAAGPQAACAELGRYREPNIRQLCTSLVPAGQRRLVRSSRARSVDRLNQLVQRGGDMVAANYAAATLGLASASTRRASAAQKQLPGSYCSGCDQTELLVYHNYSTATAMISSSASRPLASNCRSYECCVQARPALVPDPRLLMPKAAETCYAVLGCCGSSCQPAPRRARPLEPPRRANRYAPGDDDSTSLCALLPVACPSSAGTSTDSSGYLSGRERRRPPRSSSQPRLLRLCPSAGPTLREPAPPMVSCVQQQLSQRDTRQHLSTFLSPSCSSASSSSPCSYAKTKMQPVQLGSPTFSTDATSGSADGSGSTSCSGATSLSSGSEAASSCLTRLAPKPPPPPTPSRESKPEGSNGDRSKRHGGQSSESQQSPKAASEALVKTKSDQLCFVDELKLLAKRQQADAASASDSSTLIKIINASRLQAGHAAKRPQAQTSGACSCQVRTSANSSKPPKCPKGSQCNTLLESKSVKLNEQDNKRRQHGKCSHEM